MGRIARNAEYLLYLLSHSSSALKPKINTKEIINNQRVQRSSFKCWNIERHQVRKTYTLISSPGLYMHTFNKLLKSKTSHESVRSGRDQSIILDCNRYEPIVTLKSSLNRTEIIFRFWSGPCFKKPKLASVGNWFQIWFWEIMNRTKV